LDVRLVRAADVTHTLAEGVNAAKTAGPVISNADSLGDLSASDVLIVDDVAGSGETIAATRELVAKAGAGRIRTAVCVVNDLNWPAAGSSPEEALTYVGAHCRGWVIFPWENQ
jgi:hypoxanthine phosphoribosyltransferase